MITVENSEDGVIGDVNIHLDKASEDLLECIVRGVHS